MKKNSSTRIPDSATSNQDLFESLNCIKCLKPFTLVIAFFLSINSLYAQPCHCDRTAIGGACTMAPSCGNPDENACESSGGTWYFKLPCPVSLSVSLSEWEISILKTSIRISWKTLSENSNSFFTIQKSTDGLSWQTLQKLDGAGTSSTEISYSFEDNTPSIGIAYYRLQQTDLNGSEKELFQAVAKFYKDDYIFYPLPVQNSLTIEGQNLKATTVKLYSLLGKQMAVQTIEDHGKIKINFDDFLEGEYFLHLENTEISQMHKIILLPR
jgi:hypothetical protein